MLAASRRALPDRVPIWELIVNRPVIEALYPHLFQGAARARYEHGSQGAFQLQADFVEAEALDGITVFEDCVEARWLDGCNFVDEWGITWNDIAQWSVPPERVGAWLSARRTAAQRHRA